MSVPRWHRLRRWAVILSLLAGLGLPSALADSPATDFLSGVVRDGLGNGIAEAEVLVVHGAAGALSPLAAVRSDSQGRFRVANLSPGPYRIAAIKDGYLTFVTRVDTGLSRFIQVVLHPMPDLSAVHPEPLPESADWAFRVPRRGLLREIEGSPEPIEEDDPEGAESFEVADSSLGQSLVRMQVEQLFAVAAPTGGSDGGETPDLQGSQTRVHLASALGEHGKFDLSGRREALDSSLDSSEGQSSASQDTASLSLALSYNTSLDSQVAVRAFYGERSLHFMPGTATSSPTAGLIGSGPLGESRHEQRYWGYDATWFKQLDGSSSLELAFDYHDTRLQMPAISGAGLLSRVNVPTEMSNRTVGAAGVYESVPAIDHRVQIDFRAQLLDVPLPEMRAYGTDLVGAFRGVSGVSLGLNAQDTWSITGPIALIYGVGYKHAMATQDASLIAPRIGASWTRDDLLLEVLISYHDVTEWGRDGSIAQYRPFRPVGDLGYEATVELPLFADVRLTGATAYSPVQFDYLGYADGQWSNDLSPVFLTDGNAAVRRNSVGLIRDVGLTRSFLEVSQGSAEGMLAATPLLTITPLQVLADRSLQYDTGRIGLRIQPSGTDLLLEYQRVGQAPLGTRAEVRTLQRTLELRLMQDLMRMRSLGNWRFLMAVRTASLETVEFDEISAATDDELLNSLNQQISAGLSVTF